MLDLYMEMTLINIHAVNAEKGSTFLAFPFLCFILYPILTTSFCILKSEDTLLEGSRIYIEVIMKLHKYNLL